MNDQVEITALRSIVKTLKAENEIIKIQRNEYRDELFTLERQLRTERFKASKRFTVPPAPEARE